MSAIPPPAQREAHGDLGNPRAGAMIGGRYLVERTLGRGGMGAVVSARDLVSGDRVAIKRILPALAAEHDLVVRFEREARATERLRGEHVRRVLGSGVDGDGSRFMVMEYLEGEDLHALVAREGPLDPGAAVDYLIQASGALAEAHALGIVHRDLKPRNLFIVTRPDGTKILKVVDFGVAKFESPNVAGDSHDVTVSGLVLGSRNFMAPEQILSARSVDALADVWSLGAILYYLLAGKSPFAAPSLDEVSLNVLSAEPHPFSEIRPDVPPRLVEIIHRCLQRDRARRYPNVVELIRALAAVARPGEPPPGSVRLYLMRTLALGPISQLSEPALRAAPTRVEAAPARRSRLPSLSGAAWIAGSVILGGALGLLIARGTVSRAAAPRAAPTESVLVAMSVEPAAPATITPPPIAAPEIAAPPVPAPAIASARPLRRVVARPIPPSSASSISSAPPAPPAPPAPIGPPAAVGRLFDVER